MKKSKKRSELHASRCSLKLTTIINAFEQFREKSNLPSHRFRFDMQSSGENFEAESNLKVSFSLTDLITGVKIYFHLQETDKAIITRLANKSNSANPHINSEMSEYEFKYFFT